MRSLLILLGAASMLWWRASGAVDFPKADEQVLLFPALSWQTADATTWRVDIHGWIFEPDLFGDLQEPFRVLLGLPKPRVDDGSLALWRQRAHWFTVDNERGKQLAVRLGNRVRTLPSSQPNGHFSSVLELPAAPPVLFTVETAATDTRRFKGEILLIPPVGLSIVSDIDDTIKISQVLDKGELLRNTFLRSYQAVPGLAALYQHWQSQAAVFHYVSASPWQLYRPLREFMEQTGYPLGSFHLRYFRWIDETAFTLLENSSGHKTSAIETLLARYPQRRFILIGDAGEHDPEVYGALANRFPAQIEAILIRAIAGADLSSERWARAFAGLPDGLWRVFDEVAELGSGWSLPGL